MGIQPDTPISPGDGSWVIDSTTRYIYDGRRVIQERDGNNTPTVSYTRGNDLSGELEGAGGIGGLLARSVGYSSGNPTSHAYYFADGNGNITSLIDGSQNVVASYRYDPFGNLISSGGSLANDNVYRFSSKEFHAASGMYYYGFRFYDPNLQRWINRDPLEEDGGINLYSFVGDPVSRVDASGLCDGNASNDQFFGRDWQESNRALVASVESMPAPPWPNTQAQLAQARLWLDKTHPEISPAFPLRSDTLDLLGWQGFGVPYSQVLGGVVFVSPNLNKVPDDYVDTIAHEGMHTVVGPRWGAAHDRMQEQAREIERQYWRDPAGNTTHCDASHMGSRPPESPAQQNPRDRYLGAAGRRW